jgi:hypothetical protein
MNEPSQPDTKSTRQFVIALVVVLAGVGLGSLLVMRKTDSDVRNRYRQPAGLGHTVTATNTNSLPQPPR